MILCLFLVNIIKTSYRKKYIFSNEKPYSINYSNNLKIDIVTNERDFKNFFQVSWRIYNNDERWIPPLWLEIKDFFRYRIIKWFYTLFLFFINTSFNITSVSAFKTLIFSSLL